MTSKILWRKVPKIRQDLSKTYEKKMTKNISMLFSCCHKTVSEIDTVCVFKKLVSTFIFIKTEITQVFAFNI